jgi:hypothetical protein
MKQRSQYIPVSVFDFSRNLVGDIVVIFLYIAVPRLSNSLEIKRGNVLLSSLAPVSKVGERKYPFMWVLLCERLCIREPECAARDKRAELCEVHVAP